MMDAKTKEDLKERVRQFNSLQLPGQGFAMHMGTSYLVNDLWRELQAVTEPITAEDLIVAYDIVNNKMRENNYKSSGVNFFEEMAKELKKLRESKK